VHRAKPTHAQHDTGLDRVKISRTHWKCIENVRATISIRTGTANCILTYGDGVQVKKTLNKWASVNISGANWKSIGNSRAMHFQRVPLNFMCPDTVLFNFI